MNMSVHEKKEESKVKKKKRIRCIDKEIYICIFKNHPKRTSSRTVKNNLLCVLKSNTATNPVCGAIVVPPAVVLAAIVKLWRRPLSVCPEEHSNKPSCHT